VTWTRPIALVALVVAARCGPATGGPAELDTRHDRCARCRMTVSSLLTAAQVVVPGEEPAFFDDLGCLADWLGDERPHGSDGVIYVADHRTGSWVEARAAVFTRVAGLETPMGSGLIAHESARSREQDPAAQRGSSVAAVDLLGETR
jgi:copper chaperone NosL